MKSLQSRVIVTALIAITVTGLVLVATIAILMRPVLKQNQADALTAVLNAAIALEGTVTPTELAQRITKPGVSVVITKDGRSFSDGKGLGAGLGLNGIPGDFQLIPLPGFNHRMTGQDDGYLLVEDYLPNSQSIITVAAANVEAIDLFSEIMEIGLPAMLVLMLVIALALRSAMRAALKPLDDMTSLATQIASGERGRRLDV
ncbi:MAG: hypothetical protein RLZ28_318, partial [Actinomycetota bacterium]